MKRFSLALACAVLLGTLSGLYASDAAADYGANRRGYRLEAHLDLGWYGAVGAGFRADFVIVKDGLIDGVDDELSLSPGFEAMWFYSPAYSKHGDGFGFWPLLALGWTFYLNQDWSIFPEIGVVFFVGQPERYRERYWNTFVAPFLGFGGRFAFSANNSLVMRVSWPAGLQVGVTF